MPIMDLVSVPHQNPSHNNQYSVNDQKYEISPFLENNQSLCASGFYHDHETNECKDINECTFESHLCSNEKFKCINTEGSYFCADFSCPKLYIDRSAKLNKKIKDVYSEKFCVRSRCTDLDQRCLSSPLIIRKNYHVKYLSRGFLYGGTHSASMDPSLVFESLYLSWSVAALLRSLNLFAPLMMLSESNTRCIKITLKMYKY